MFYYLSWQIVSIMSKGFQVQRSHADRMLSTVAAQYLSCCVDFVSASPSILDLLLMYKLSILSRIQRNIAELVDVITKVTY